MTLELQRVTLKKEDHLETQRAIELVKQNPRCNVIVQTKSNICIRICMKRQNTDSKVI